MSVLVLWSGTGDGIRIVFSSRLHILSYHILNASENLVAFLHTEYSTFIETFLIFSQNSNGATS